MTGSHTHEPPFIQDPNKHDSDKERAQRFKAIPAIDAQGKPAVLLIGFRNMAFLPEPEAYRISNEIADILDNAGEQP